MKANRGALRGTAMHRVMECMDFASYLDWITDSIEDEQCSNVEIRGFVERELSRMVPDLLTEEQLELINKDKLVAFFASPVALRMAEADKRGNLFKEKPFVMDYEGALLQGIIDVFWIEEDRIVLLDYKTDCVKTLEELKQRYETQLELYAQALCRIFSSKERTIEQTENLIYSFCFNEVLVL